MAPTQYAFRSLKQLAVMSGPPEYTPVSSFQPPESASRAFKYSADGRVFATASSLGVHVYDAQTCTLLSEIPVKAAIDLSLSPLGTHISTWERHVKTEDGQPGHKNIKVWDVKTGAELAGFTQKSMEEWALQYTEDEAKAVRLATNEVQVYDPSNLSAGVIAKLRLEGVSSCAISPGLNPSVALFVAERKGAPASVKIHSLSTLAIPSSSKTFYKADKITLKWNKTGTSLLFLTATEVDKTGKSYYGETNLYMMTTAGNLDARVTLDKEGGIHDFAWSPNDNEFTVTYGYMPAKTVIFDKRAKPIHDLGMHPRNFVAYNPQGRLLCVAGFGNLAGQVDIWDRQTLKKICTIDAPNTSHCEWSPDGRFLLCATLSPRLRVDNGVRIFHYSGKLVHVESLDELYQASWRPAKAELFPFANGSSVEAAPAPSPSVNSIASTVKPAAPAGAYRPPHARGTVTPSLFKREDQGGAAYNGLSNNGTSSSASAAPSRSGGRRTIPGAAVPGMNGSNGDESNKSRRKKKEGGGAGAGGKVGGRKGGDDSSAAPSGTSTPSREAQPQQQQPPATKQQPVLVAAATEALSSSDKKRRALLKKLTAIEQLKLKAASGEKLELTQLKKLNSEDEIRAELEALDLAK